MYEWMHRNHSGSRVWREDERTEAGGNWLLGWDNKDDIHDGDLFVVISTFINPAWGEEGEDVWLALCHSNGRASWHVFRVNDREKWRRLDDPEFDSNAVLTRSPAI
mgnify:CR=1 FL=1